MATAAAKAQRQGGIARSALRERLEARRGEIEAAALTRVRAIADPAEVSDPAYAEGLRAAVAAAVDYGIETTGRDGADPPVPVTLLAQARMAARARIPLDTVLRRYFAGYSLLGYFILEEATHAGLTDGAELQRLLGAHAGIFDRLLAAVGEEYGRESEQAGPVSASRRQVERIERLLAGEMVDTSIVSYDFEGWHLGMVVDGPEAAQHVRDLAANLDCHLLFLPREGHVIWVWLGARRRRDPADLLTFLGAASGGEEGPAIALGEPAEGLAGWRLTHCQAMAALPVARRAPGPAVRYADVALLAMTVHDDLLATSLRRLYLEPLECAHDGGAESRRTLRAYFRASGNISSAAAAIGVNRNTIAARLSAIERKIGRPLSLVAPSLSVAIQLKALDEHKAVE